jgi:PTS system nitrogen regulatory IIA component
MRFRDIFQPERVKLNLKAKSKEEAFEEMVDLLMENYNLCSREDILKAIQEREQKISTGIKRGIAIPHGKTSAVDEVMGVIGISPTGIDYDALDGEPVYLIFLLVSSENDPGQHLEILKKIALLVENSDFYHDMINAQLPESIPKIFNKYEKILGLQRT